MKHKTLIAAALAASAFAGLGVAQAAPAVVAGTTPYGNSGSVPYYGGGTAPYYGSTAPYYGNTQVYTYPSNTVVVQGAPPAPIYESVPASREGYIWAPGHYVWENGRYHWRGGEWMASRPGYAWQAARWEQRSDGSWYLVGGTWVRTDNVAYGDNRRGPYGDRDGDGVINRDDNYPRNPNRW
ncbi:YXWGXW repeat-containing protein [Ramlibacter sp. USB13]|uniref:YXWGXW repeat-containing protein n=1 Tax=Ramlibacter cellulosilyticus TaxID=2764187 RepID=A0A923SB89_9BURK|nr:YXWGXW repeat-containing protein [Ramlibacter cellulosilyticus]MBC5783611.1 YXWGXW repeat-containing protein [Ramlibacter cellulosilyticus]